MLSWNQQLCRGSVVLEHLLEGSNKSDITPGGSANRGSVTPFSLEALRTLMLKEAQELLGRRIFSNLSRSSLGPFSHHTIAERKKLDVTVTMILETDLHEIITLSTH